MHIVAAVPTILSCQKSMLVTCGSMRLFLSWHPFCSTVCIASSCRLKTLLHAFWFLATFCQCASHCFQACVCSKKFSKGAAIFEQPLCKGYAAIAPGVSWHVYIYIDVPDEGSTAFDSGQPVHKLHNATIVSVAQGVDTPVDKRLAMLFEGCFWGEHGPGLSAPVLLDSGASSNFVSPGFLQQLSISHSPSSAKLKLADSSEAPILGKVRLRFKLQHFTATATCFVT